MTKLFSVFLGFETTQDSSDHQQVVNNLVLVEARLKELLGTAPRSMDASPGNEEECRHRIRHHLQRVAIRTEVAKAWDLK